MQMVKWPKTGISNVAGEVSLVAGLALWATTIPRIRHKFFELFFYTHHLYILFVVFFIFHVGVSYTCMMLPGFYLFLVDRYLRFLQSRQSVRLVSARILPCETVELNFSKTPGKFSFLTCLTTVGDFDNKNILFHLFTRVELYCDKHYVCERAKHFEAAMASFYCFFQQ